MGGRKNGGRKENWRGEEDDGKRHLKLWKNLKNVLLLRVLIYQHCAILD